MLERDELEVGELDEGPDHPVLGEGGLVGRGELVLGAAALEHGHGGQEEAHVDRGEDQLVGGHAGHDGAVGRLQLDALQRLEPRRRGGTEDDCGRCEVGVSDGVCSLRYHGSMVAAFGTDRAGNGASLTATVAGHAGGAIPLVLLETLALNDLLGHGVAGREQNL